VQNNSSFRRYSCSYGSVAALLAFFFLSRLFQLRITCCDDILSTYLVTAPVDPVFLLNVFFSFALVSKFNKKLEVVLLLSVGGGGLLLRGYALAGGDANACVSSMLIRSRDHMWKDDGFLGYCVEDHLDCLGLGRRSLNCMKAFGGYQIGMVGTTSCFVLGLSFADWRGTVSSYPYSFLKCVVLLWAAYGGM